MRIAILSALFVVCCSACLKKSVSSPATNTPPVAGTPVTAAEPAQAAKLWTADDLYKEIKGKKIPYVRELLGVPDDGKTYSPDGYITNTRYIYKGRGINPHTQKVSNLRIVFCDDLVWFVKSDD